MIKTIKLHHLLMQCIVSECCEHGISATISENILEDNYVILDIDEYYKTIKKSNRTFKLPPSIDCLVLIKCSDGNYKLLLIELKDLSSDYTINKSSIVGKFKTTIKDFLETRHPSTFLFYNNLKEFDLFLVTNPYHWSEDDSINDKLKSTRLNFLTTMKPFKYNGITRKIQLKLPNPVIQNC